MVMTNPVKSHCSISYMGFANQNSVYDTKNVSLFVNNKIGIDEGLNKVVNFVVVSLWYLCMFFLVLKTLHPFFLK
jgi:hypothetical protein